MAEEQIQLRTSELMTALRLLGTMLGKLHEQRSTAQEEMIFWDQKVLFRKIVMVAANMQHQTDVKILPHPAVAERILAGEQCPLEQGDLIAMLNACILIFSRFERRLSQNALREAIRERGRKPKDRRKLD